MLKLEEIRRDSQVRGIAPEAPVKVLSVEHIGDDAVPLRRRGTDGIEHRLDIITKKALITSE